MAGKTAGGVRFSLIFLFLFVSRQKEKKEETTKFKHLGMLKIERFVMIKVKINASQPAVAETEACVLIEVNEESTEIV